VERRQVFDLQPVRAEVTGHQLIERECGCGHRTKGTAPAGAEAPVQYGPRIAAIIVYLYAGQFLSKNRTALALAELFGIPLSSGTVAALTARAAGRLDGFLDQVREQIAASPVAGSGETGFRVAGRLAWVHCPYRQVRPTHGPPPAREGGDRGDGRACLVRRGRRPLSTVHRRQARPQFLRCPCHARPR
jgi:hypothetical protein